MVEVRASAKYVRVAPNKARQVVRHIKGLEVDEARRLLEFSPKGVARQIRKTLDSAVANAEHNNDLHADDLVVTGAWVDEGPTLRRFQPRAMGRAYRIRKRTSHITVTVGVPVTAGAAVPAAAAAGPAPSAATAETTSAPGAQDAEPEAGAEPEPEAGAEPEPEAADEREKE